MQKHINLFKSFLIPASLITFCLITSLSSLLSFSTVFSEESFSDTKADTKVKDVKSEKDPKKEMPKDEAVVTSNTIKIGNIDVSYKATVGTQILKDDQDNPKASIFYIAYTKENVENKKTRPVTFCFNGGPGSSSVWLHLGIFGPKRVNIDDNGITINQPYGLVDNPYSILDLTDLVFIDPVSTGYSRAAPGEDVKQFHGVDEDVQSVAKFIRLYTTRNELWESPKYLAGESYGTTRAAALALELHDKHHFSLEGILLISTVLNFQTISFHSGNDLPYILFLPSYTATALYHQRLSDDLQNNSSKTMEDVQEFAYNEYAHALMKGEHLDNAQREAVLNKLARYTGIPKEYIDRSNLRIHMYRFAKELLKDQRRTVGRFDSRFKGIDSDTCDDIFEFDPSLDDVIGLFTATFNNYIRAELNWKTDEEYKTLTNVYPWNYGSNNQYLNVGEKLKEVMGKNNSLRIYVASGFTDLAVPFSASKYTFSHLGLDPSLRPNIVAKTYDGGHMMFLNKPTLIKMKSDLTNFYQSSNKSKREMAIKTKKP